MLKSLKSCIVKIGRFDRKMAHYKLEGGSLTLIHADATCTYSEGDISRLYENDCVVLRIRKSKTDVFLPIEQVLPVEHQIPDEQVWIPYAA